MSLISHEISRADNAGEISQYSFHIADHAKTISGKE